MLSKEYVAHHLEKLHTYLWRVGDGTAIVGNYERKAVERFISFNEKYDYRNLIGA